MTNGKNTASVNSATSGLWRAKIVKDLGGGKAKVYIPAIHKEYNPFEDKTVGIFFKRKVTTISDKYESAVNEDYAENDSQLSSGSTNVGGTSGEVHFVFPTATSCFWQYREPFNVGDPVWIMFENGDTNYPVIMGQLGSVLALNPDSDGGPSQRASFSLSGLFGGDSSAQSAVAAAANSATVSEIFTLLKSGGLSEASACGILGNMQYESGFNLGALNPNDLGATSYGLCQWRAGRYQNLINWCQVNGYELNSAKGQVTFLLNELNTTEVNAKSAISSVPNNENGAYTAGEKFCALFERPQYPQTEGPKRGEAARGFYKTLVLGAGAAVANGASLQEVANIARTFRGGYYGGGSDSSRSGNCEAWVEDVYYNVYGKETRYGDANAAAAANGISSDMSKVPVGAVVWTKYSPHGHAAIYIGDGKVASNYGSNIPVIETLSGFISWASRKPGYSGAVWGYSLKDI